MNTWKATYGLLCGMALAMASVGCGGGGGGGSASGETLPVSTEDAAIPVQEMSQQIDKVCFSLSGYDLYSTEFLLSDASEYSQWDLQGWDPVPGFLQNANHSPLVDPFEVIISGRTNSVTSLILQETMACEEGDHSHTLEFGTVHQSYEIHFVVGEDDAKLGIKPQVALSSAGSFTLTFDCRVAPAVPVESTNTGPEDPNLK